MRKTMKHPRLVVFSYFQNQLFKHFISGIPSVSNSLDPDIFYGPDLG